MLPETGVSALMGWLNATPESCKKTNPSFTTVCGSEWLAEHSSRLFFHVCFIWSAHTEKDASKRFPETYMVRDSTNIAGSRAKDSEAAVGWSCVSYCLQSDLRLLSGSGVGYNRAIGKHQDFGKSHLSLNLFSICNPTSCFMFVSNLGSDVSSKLSQ